MAGFFCEQSDPQNTPKLSNLAGLSMTIGKDGLLVSCFEGFSEREWNRTPHTNQNTAITRTEAPDPDPELCTFNWALVREFNLSYHNRDL